MSAWTKTQEAGVTVYQRQCKHCGGTYIFGYGCRTANCATGAIWNQYVFLWSKDVFFARSFASSMFSSLTTLFALMGFQQIRKPMQMYSKGLSRLRLLLSLLRSLSSPKQQILHLKRRGSGRMNLNFDSSICLLWLPKVLFFGIKCSVFGISFSGMIIWGRMGWLECKASSSWQSQDGSMTMFI